MEKHCAHLQALANVVGKSSDEQRYSAIADLKKYLYLQCAPKIIQQLNISMHGDTRGTFLDALSVPFEQLVEEYPEGLSWSKIETVLAKVWEREKTTICSIAKYIVKHEFIMLDYRKHIVVGENSFQHYHNFVSKVLGTYNNCLQKLLRKRQTNAASGLELEEASGLPTKLNKSGNIL